MSKHIVEEGSVRVDLLGGTLDIHPINLILEKSLTLNVATSLKARVEIIETDREEVEIISEDYQTNFIFKKSDFTNIHFYSDYFGHMKFVIYILNFFKIQSHICLKLKSGSPPGSGLGGSSAMGITLYSGLCKFKKIPFDRSLGIKIIQDIESQILNSGPAGFQDYYPAVYGGILSLTSRPGEIVVEQLFNENFKLFLEKHITLIYSGETRSSGINNWEVYKGFFDQKEEIIKGLHEIGKLSTQAYLAIKNNSYFEVIELISNEGMIRETLFPKIVTDKIKDFVNQCREKIPKLGMKMCGAGGGGCFLLLHQENDYQKIESIVDGSEMKKLEFKIDKPII